MGKLFEAIGVAELIDDPRFHSVQARSANIDALYATLANGMKHRTTEIWLAELQHADLPCGEANSIDGLFTNSYLTKTGYFEACGHPVEGPVVTLALPAHYSKTSANVIVRGPCWHP